DAPPRSAAPAPAGPCTLDSLDAATQSAPDRWRCQATEHVRATTPLRWSEPGPYWRDLTSRNVSLRDFLRYALLAFYNIVQRRRGRRTWPWADGSAGKVTPTEKLDLKPGELV